MFWAGKSLWPLECDSDRIDLLARQPPQPRPAVGCTSKRRIPNGWIHPTRPRSRGAAVAK